MDSNNREWIMKAEYLAEGESAHRKYYAQFVTEKVRQRVRMLAWRILRYPEGSEEAEAYLCRQYDESHTFDGISMRYWNDTKLYPETHKALRQCGDDLTLYAQIEILKEAALQLVEQYRAAQTTGRSDNRS